MIVFRHECILSRECLGGGCDCGWGLVLLLLVVVGVVGLDEHADTTCERACFAIGVTRFDFDRVRLAMGVVWACLTDGCDGEGLPLLWEGSHMSL